MSNKKPHCKICGKEYAEPLVYIKARPPWQPEEIRYPVCSMLCAALYRRWQMGKLARRHRGGCRGNRVEV